MLVEAYEERRWSKPTPLRSGRCAALRHQRTRPHQAELAKIVGSRSRASEILSRRRPLTLEMIQKITTRCKIPADLLVQRYRVGTRAA